LLQHTIMLENIANSLTSLGIYTQPPIGYDIISVTEVTQGDFIGANRERKQVLGLFLTLTHGSATSQINTNRRMHVANGASRQRVERTTNNTRGYDRIMYFLDISHRNGQMFAVVSDTAHDAKEMFSQTLRSQAGVGHVFTFIEPDRTGSYLGRDTYDVPIIKKAKACFPLSNPIEDIMVESRPYLMNEGETRAFALLKVTKVQISNVNIEEACCKGIQCDRQKILPNSLAGCGCFFTKGRHKLVLDMTVTLEDLDDPMGQDGHLFCEHFRSHETSKFFIPDEASWVNISTNNMHRDIQLGDKVRQLVSEMVTYINQEHGGWTCVGWTRRGETTDASDQSQTVASENVNPHITYMRPSGKVEDIMASDGYKERVIKIDDSGVASSIFSVADEAAAAGAAADGN